MPTHKPIPDKLRCKETPQDLHYTRNTIFPSIPYNYSALSQRILLNSVPISVQTTIPVGKIIREITKILKLNVFQCSLLNFTLSQNEFSCEEIENNRAIQQLLIYDESVYSNRRYASVFVLMLFNGYYVKSVANKTYEMEGVDEAVKRIIPSFNEAYDVWEDRKTLRKMSLMEINDIFKKNSFVGPKDELVENYNVIVDQILEMSKPYTNKNPGEGEMKEEGVESEEKREKERRKGEKSKKEKSQFQLEIEKQKKIALKVKEGQGNQEGNMVEEQVSPSMEVQEYEGDKSPSYHDEEDEELLNLSNYSESSESPPVVQRQLSALQSMHLSRKANEPSTIYFQPSPPDNMLGSLSRSKRFMEKLITTIQQPEHEDTLFRNGEGEEKPEKKPEESDMFKSIERNFFNNFHERQNMDEDLMGFMRQDSMLRSSIRHPFMEPVFYDSGVNHKPIKEEEKPKGSQPQQPQPSQPSQPKQKQKTPKPSIRVVESEQQN